MLQALKKGLNPEILIASLKLKESFIECKATTWEDVQNRYESKFLVEHDFCRSHDRMLKVRGRLKVYEKSNPIIV